MARPIVWVQGPGKAPAAALLALASGRIGGLVVAQYDLVLSDQPLDHDIAVIVVQAEGPVLIQRTTASVVVRVNDEPLGVGPAELRHGAHIDLPGCRLTYDAERGPAPSALEGVDTTQSPVASLPPVALLIEQMSWSMVRFSWAHFSHR